MPKELLLERSFRSQKMSARKLSARTGTGRIAYNFMHAAFEEATRLSADSAVGVADSLLDLLLLPFCEVDTMFARVGPEPRCMFERSSSSASICVIPRRRGR